VVNPVRETNPSGFISPRRKGFSNGINPFGFAKFPLASRPGGAGRSPKNQAGGSSFDKLPASPETMGLRRAAGQAGLTAALGIKFVMAEIVSFEF
jgi:hypothetical protein